MRGRSRRPGKAMPKAMMAAKLMRAASAAPPMPNAAPDLDEAMPAAPAAPSAGPPMPPSGATDGLGAGQGGLAIHPSLKGYNVHGREPRHTSRTR